MAKDDNAESKFQVEVMVQIYILVLERIMLKP